MAVFEELVRMPNKIRKKWQRPFYWPPSTWEFTAGLQVAADLFLLLVLCLALITILAAIFIWPVLLWKTVNDVISGKPDDVRNTLLAIAGLIGIPFLVWRTLIASKQANIGRENHYTTLFTKAVEQLGADKVVKRRVFKPEYKRDDNGRKVMSDKGAAIPLLDPDNEPLGEHSVLESTEKNYEVRLGAIYALERIAKDSRRDGWPIYLTLAAYIQNNAQKRHEIAAIAEPLGNQSDIEETFNVLSRYDGEHPEDVSVLFEAIHLENIDLVGSTLQSMVFSKCSIARFRARNTIKDISFQDCAVDELTPYLCTISHCAFVDGSYKVLNFQNGKVDQVDVICSNIQKLHISQTQVTDSTFNVGETHIVFAASQFSGCVFTDIEQAYSGGNGKFTIIQNEFRNCAFVRCNFTWCDLTTNRFFDCTFENCCLVKIGEILGDNNKIENCMTDENVLTTNSYEIRRLWIDWKYSDKARGGPSQTTII